ncbi:MAG TPA: DUF4846 domain-containing protein [Chitinophagaceae bacterium]|nr:DUF4846 domain-containing protein [Chitinophagaceae bacterium]
MNLLLAAAIILPVLSCEAPGGYHLRHKPEPAIVPSLPVTVEAISLPPGYERMAAPAGSFTTWLRQVPLKKSNVVYLYNGSPKRNQNAQYAVLDISVGNQDLQQCADAVMRLRAEYLFAFQQWDAIVFKDNASRAYCYTGGNNRAAFDSYLRRVFGWCGTASLEKQLTPVRRLNQLEAGDVLIKGGFPGHAVIVMDVAANRKGEKIYLLAQSYMPAQDIHILKNPMEPGASPWYKVVDNQAVITPEWTFQPGQLRRW